MAEVSCPMCGKLNPADRQVCQFCDARLVPLIAETPPEGEKPFRPDETFPADGESGAQDERSEQEERSPDWLTDLREVDSSSSEVFDELESPDAASSYQDEEAEDWFSRLGKQEQEDESLETEDRDDEHEVEDASDWLSRLKQGSQDDEAGESADQDVAGWLSQLDADERDDQEPSPGVEQFAGESMEASEVPEWLQEMQAAQQESSEQASEEALEAFEEDPDGLSEGAQSDSEILPEWLREVAQQEEEVPAGPSEEESLPDWLVDQDEETAPEREAPPEWLSEAEGEREDAAVSQQELPDWLSEFPADANSEQFEAPAAPQEEPVEEFPFEAKAPVPDWSSEMPAENEAGAEAQQPDEAFEFDAFDLEADEEETAPPAGSLEEEGPDEPFDWGEFDLEEVAEGGEVAPVESVETEESDEAYTVELPDQWFPEDLEELQPGSVEEVEPEISRAEIPSWLESMRPVEDAAPSTPVKEEDKQQVESAGPLAGLRGVLSAEPEIAKVQKPPTYSIKLHVTENQHAHADLLKAMLADEGQFQPIAGPAIISSQHLLRAVIGLILIVAVFWPVLTGTQQAPLPTFSPETAAANRLISQLPNQSRVLMSFDYEPGLTGEMDAAASAVVDHLMLRGAYLTLVSTSPVGPIVAERFLSTTQVEHNYTSLEEYINLGFVPGGPAGLLSFAETPQRILPYTLDGNFAWSENLAPLQGIEQLADFDLVLVITDNPSVARIWVEQVQPYLEGGDSPVPLMMVTSAQAEPLVRPYYRPASGQVQGLVSGLQGGGAYALLTGRGGLARQYWDAFSLGLWVAAALVISGGVINIVLVLLERSRKASG
jgi:hypothetical protein